MPDILSFFSTPYSFCLRSSALLRKQELGRPDVVGNRTSTVEIMCLVGNKEEERQSRDPKNTPAQNAHRNVIGSARWSWKVSQGQ